MIVNVIIPETALAAMTVAEAVIETNVGKW